MAPGAWQMMVQITWLLWRHRALNIDNTPDCLHWWPERGVQQPPDVTRSQHSMSCVTGEKWRTLGRLRLISISWSIKTDKQLQIGLQFTIYLYPFDRMLVKQWFPSLVLVLHKLPYNIGECCCVLIDTKHCQWSPVRWGWWRRHCWQSNH